MTERSRHFQAEYRVRHAASDPGQRDERTVGAAACVRTDGRSGKR